jgi:hypothetical protein
MAEALIELTERLSEVLSEETGLLNELDLPAAGGLLARKRDAVTALQKALADGAITALPPEEAAALRASVQRMTELAEANEIAVERGLAVQMRLIQTIAQTVPRARAIEAPIYQPNGSQVPPRPPEAYAFLRRM